MIVLGLGAPFHHDPAAALVVDGEVVAAAEEERFTRLKHAPKQLPINAARFCLERAGIQPSQVDAVAFPWSPESFAEKKRAYFKRCLKNRRSRALKALYRGPREHEKKQEKVSQTLKAIGIDPGKVAVHYLDHHLCHASSAYHLSGFGDSAILTVDGSGEFTATMFAEGVGGEIKKIHEVLNPDSLGFFYSTVTEYLGFRRDNGEFKTMGMSAYGDPGKADVSHMLTVTADGYQVNDDHVWTPRQLRHQVDKMFSKGTVEKWGPPREGDGLSEPYIHIAAAAQEALERVVLKHIDTYLKEPLERTGGRLCLAGGCALNVRMNRKILEHPLVKEIWVQPAAHDAGAPLGAATLVAHQAGDTIKPMQHAYLGPAYTDEQIEAALHKVRVPFKRLKDTEAETAAILAKGEIVAWFQGAMEFGPRALGNRSILGSPAVAGVANEINARIKFREKWRPFCPSLLAEAAPEILGTEHPSPYMTFSFMISEEWRKKIPEAVHVDGSARPQIVDAENNPRYHKLISAFRDQTGIPVLINTSLNRRGEPMVCSPEDALTMFFGCGLEHMVIGDYYVSKRAMDPSFQS